MARRRPGSGLSPKLFPTHAIRAYDYQANTGGQRFMVGIDTEKVFATPSLGLPASTAASTLDLGSFEYGFMPEG